MIEIKFRAWTGGAMIYDAVVIKYTAKQMAGDIPLGHYYSPSFCSSHMEEIMQYTGLKDKNGVEIYEGDIMKDYDNDCIGIVSFQDGAFIVTYENEFCNAFEWSNEVVIGNIYENPELLKETK